IEGGKVARVSLIEEGKHPELAGLIAAIKAERGGRLANLYRALLNSPAVAQGQIDALPEWQGSKSFDDRERAVLSYTDCVTREIRVPDSVFAQARRHFDDRELVELTATVAGYNLVSRFLVAMQIDQEPPKSSP